MEQPRRRGIKEPFSGLSHMVGAALSVAALVILLIVAHGRPWHVVSFAIYGASMIVLYTSSTLYHSLQVGSRAVSRLKKMDYITIFLLIAGTYAPICLVTLRGGWGWSLLGTEYGLAALGITIIACWNNPPSWIRVVIYICMGWLAVLAIGPLRAALPAWGLVWLIGGGLAYSIGTVVYATQRPRLWPGIFEAHDLWHLFVLGGSACHFILVLCFIA